MPLPDLTDAAQPMAAFQLPILVSCQSAAGPIPVVQRAGAKTAANGPAAARQLLDQPPRRSATANGAFAAVRGCLGLMAAMALGQSNRGPAACGPLADIRDFREAGLMAASETFIPVYRALTQMAAIAILISFITFATIKLVMPPSPWHAT